MTKYNPQWLLEQLVICDAIRGRGNKWYPLIGINKYTEKSLVEKGVLEKRPIDKENESEFERIYGVHEVCRIKDIALANRELKGSVGKMMKQVAFHYGLLHVHTKDGDNVSITPYDFGMNVPPEYVKAIESLWRENKIYAMKCFKFLGKHERSHYEPEIANNLRVKFEHMLGSNWAAKGKADVLNGLNTKEALAFKSYEGHTDLTALDLSLKFYNEDPLEHLIFRIIWTFWMRKFHQGYFLPVSADAYKLMFMKAVEDELSDFHPWLRPEIEYKIKNEVWKIWNEIEKSKENKDMDKYTK